MICLLVFFLWKLLQELFKQAKYMHSNCKKSCRIVAGSCFEHLSLFSVWWYLWFTRPLEIYNLFEFSFHLISILANNFAFFPANFHNTVSEISWKLNLLGAWLECYGRSRVLNWIYRKYCFCFNGDLKKLLFFNAAKC